MTLTFLKVISRITYVLFAFIVYLSFTDVKADTAHINYVSSTSDQYTQLKSELEDLGYTVTGTNSGSVTLSDFSSKDLHINIAGDSNCGSNCKTAYETYIGNGGNVIIAGNGVYNNNRAGNIEQLIESKLSVGAITIYSGVANYTSHANGSYSGDASSGYWVTRSLFSMQSGGTAIASNSSNGSTWKSWAKYDYGSNGGQLFVTFDQSQFKNTNSSWMTRFYGFLQQTLENEGILSTVSYSSAPTTTQTNLRTTTRSITTDKNSIYINQSGNNLDLDITQYDDKQLIAGLGTTSSSIDPANITGNNNTISITQGNNSGSFSDGNTVLFDVNGDSNNLTIRQGDNIDDDGDHDLRLNVVGNTNTGSFTQEEDGAVGNAGHFMDVDIAGNSNSIDIDQNDDGDKMLFLDINGDSNTIDLDQRGTGNHFLDVTVTNNQTVTVDQNGSGDHAATINMSGNTSGLDLTQNSSSDQTYSLTQICNTGGGCGTTTFTQN